LKHPAEVVCERSRHEGCSHDPRRSTPLAEAKVVAVLVAVRFEVTCAFVRRSAVSAVTKPL